MICVSEEDLISGEWDRVLNEEISAHYRYEHIVHITYRLMMHTESVV